MKVLEFAGPVVFCYFLLSTASSGVTIMQEKTTKSLSPVPFVTLFASCFLWSVYGLMRADNTIFIPNVIGTVVSGWCVFIFGRYASKIAWEVHTAALVVLLLTFHLYQQGDVDTLGTFGCILSILVTAAPLATISTVLKDKSTASLPPFGTIFAMFMNSVSWTLYGAVVAEDANVWIPNLLGLSIALVLLSLFVVFPSAE